MTLNRREILVGGGASIAVPFFSGRSHAADVDVVVIGAGAAGLAATGTLLADGKSVKLLEAANRIGGRAFTESNTFGVPFDQGCTFQHVVHKNPWVEYAKSNGFEIGKLPSDDLARVNVGRREATGEEYEAMISREAALSKALKAGGRSGQDISMRRAIKRVKKNKWTPIAEFWKREGTAQELKDISIKDWWAGLNGEDYYCPAGYGTLVSHFGRDIPVTLNTTVQKIDWSGKSVAVTTDKGVITARYCIVTVSVGVLLANDIRFEPELPDWKRSALDGFNMGNYITIGLKFSVRRIIPVQDNVHFWMNGSHDQMLSFMSNMGGHGVSRANASGNLAKELENAGKDAAIEFSLARLKEGLGSTATKTFSKGSLSTWINNPLTRGTWAMAKPGKAHLRPKLRKQVGKTVFFAGEACHKNMFGTCQGALLSGQATAKQVVKLLH